MKKNSFREKAKNFFKKVKGIDEKLAAKMEGVPEKITEFGNAVQNKIETFNEAVSEAHKQQQIKHEKYLSELKDKYPDFTQEDWDNIEEQSNRYKNYKF